MNYSLIKLLLIFATYCCIVFPSFHCLQNSFQNDQEHGNLLQEEIQLFDWKILQKEIQGAPAKKNLLHTITIIHLRGHFSTQKISTYVKKC